MGLRESLVVHLRRADSTVCEVASLVKPVTLLANLFTAPPDEGHKGREENVLAGLGVDVSTFRERDVAVVALARGGRAICHLGAGELALDRRVDTRLGCYCCQHLTNWRTYRT